MSQSLLLLNVQSTFNWKIFCLKIRGKCATSVDFGGLLNKQAVHNVEHDFYVMNEIINRIKVCLLLCLCVVAALHYI